MLKRFVHIVGQSAELGMEANVVADCPQPSVANKYHPFMASSRRRGNKALAQSLVARFHSRGGGYITAKEELNLKQLGIVDQKSFGSKTASEFCARVLLKVANFMTGFVSEKKSSVLNLCFDGAMVSTEHVLSVIMRVDGVHFAAPTQLLPLCPSRQQAQEALLSLQAWLNGKLPEYQKGAMHVLKDANFKWKEYRSSTKALLVGLANALQQCMPAGFTLKDCIPKHPLKPCPISCSRFRMTDAEKKAFQTERQGDYFCIFDHRTHERSCDYIYDDNAFFHLCMAADEGTEGFLVWQHLSSQHVWCVFWADLFHKVARKTTLALATPPNGSLFMRKVNRLFRMLRGPWGTGKFGKMMAEARGHLIKLIEKGEGEEIVDMYLAGCARDVGKDVATFGRQDILELLKKKQGSVHVCADSPKDVRWFSFFDHGQCWNARWHTEMLVLSYSFWLEGKNPWSVKAVDITDDIGQDSYSSRVAAWNVLADDQNQDKIRSILRVFAPARIFLAEYDRDMQSTPDASVKHGLQLASGKRVKSLVMKTLQNCVTEECLEFVNALGPDEEHAENLEWHVSLMLGQIRAVYEIHVHHQSFPWRCILALDPQKWSELLAHMKTTWAFVQTCIDTLPLTHSLCKHLLFTRYQAFRDLMVKAEHFQFDASKMRDEISAPFRYAVKAVCGMTSSNVTSLLSSLPSELAFNDLRDSGRRHARAEKIAPQNIHSIAHKSAEKRCMGCKPMALEAADWTQQLDKKTIRTSVYNATRATDCALGVDSTGLTRNPSNMWYTKPHILSQRLELMWTLCKIFNESSATETDDKRNAVEAAFRNSWTSSVVPLHTLISFKDDASDLTRGMLVIRAGPFNVLVLDLTKKDDHLTLLHGVKTYPRELFVDDMEQILVSKALPVTACNPSDRLALGSLTSMFPSRSG